MQAYAGYAVEWLTFAAEILNRAYRNLAYTALRQNWLQTSIQIIRLRTRQASITDYAVRHRLI